VTVRPPRCGVCGHSIDVTAEHVTIVRQIERVAGMVDNEPQHLVEDAEVLVSYHEGCERFGWRQPAESPAGTLRLTPRDGEAAS
jgi:hypothetical protein